MNVAVVNVRVMRVLVSERGMVMQVSVWFSAIPLEIMLVLMMLVVLMSVTMHYFFVRMLMLMSFGKVQPHSARHQCTRQTEQQGRGFSKHQDRHGGTEEWCRREVSASACEPVGATFFL